jgi:hypothetical protein
VLLLAGLAVVLVAGCSQDEDIVSPVSTTELTLSALRLPTPPSGMIYELWAANSSETLSLGKFSYREEFKRFMDETGAARDNIFSLGDDIFKYNSVFVSVEVHPDNNLSAHGPIMLIDDVSDPANSPFQLAFPLADSLWEGYVRYNMEGVSDRDRHLNDGNGLWFSRYQATIYDVPDTFAILIDTVDSVINTGSSPVTFIVGVEDIETTITFVEQDTTLWSVGKIWLGDQPLVHYGLSFRFITYIDSTLPYEARALSIKFDTASRNDTVELFSQDYRDLPDYSSWGWKYKGWVVLAHYNSVPMTTRWRMTPPVWRYKTENYNWMPGDSGVLFTTGTFSRIDLPDDGNPYKLDGPVAPFPGEDFLNSTVLQAQFGIDRVEMMPQAAGNVGTVFISLEPDNSPYDTTNFPLILMTQSLPYLRDTTITNNTLVSVSMMNRSGTLDNDPISPGFPQIDIALKRF